MHHNLTSQKLIIEKVLEEYREVSFDSFHHTSSEFEQTIDKMHTKERDSK